LNKENDGVSGKGNNNNNNNNINNNNNNNKIFQMRCDDVFFFGMEQFLEDYSGITRKCKILN
jgi:hypothetical protein